jgi:hypothetical protein
VRSRVENLSVHAPHMTIPALKEALAQAFADTYGASERVSIADVLAPVQVDELTQKYRSWEWTYGKTPRFDVQMETRFAWGGVELMLSLRHGTVEHATCFTDAMDADLGQRVAGLLVGSVYEPPHCRSALQTATSPKIVTSLLGWLHRSCNSQTTKPAVRKCLRAFCARWRTKLLPELVIDHQETLFLRQNKVL